MPLTPPFYPVLRAKLLVYPNLTLIHQFIQLAVNLYTHSPTVNSLCPMNQ